MLSGSLDVSISLCDHPYQAHSGRHEWDNDLFKPCRVPNGKLADIKKQYANEGPYGEIVQASVFNIVCRIESDQATVDVLHSIHMGQ